MCLVGKIVHPGASSKTDVTCRYQLDRDGMALALGSSPNFPGTLGSGIRAMGMGIVQNGASEVTRSITSCGASEVPCARAWVMSICSAVKETPNCVILQPSHALMQV